MRVILHQYDFDPSDLTEFVQSVEWSESTAPPWGSLRLTLRMTLADAKATISKSTQGGNGGSLGDWLILSQDDGKALMIARIVSVERSRQVQDVGGFTLEHVDITAEGWLDALGHLRMIVAPARGNWASEAARFYIRDFKSWGSTLTAWLSGAFANIYALLSGIWEEIVSLELPKSTQIGNLRYVVVAGNQKARPKQQIDVPGSTIAALSAASTDTTILAMLQKGFGGDPRLVEFFPMMEAPNKENSSAVPVEGTGGQVLSLIYRLRPFLTSPLSSESIEGAALARGASMWTTPYAERVGLFQEAITLKPDLDTESYTITADNIYSPPSFNWSDDERINAVHVEGIFSSGVSTSLGVVSEPFIAGADVARNGIRLYAPQWPFFIREGVVADQSIQDRLSAITEYAYAVAGQAEQYRDGQIEIAYRPKIHCGNWFSAEIHPGQWITAYAHAVSHRVRVDESGREVSRTTLGFVRGSVGAESWVARMAIPLRGLTFAPRKTGAVGETGEDNGAS